MDFVPGRLKGHESQHKLSDLRGGALFRRHDPHHMPKDEQKDERIDSASPIVKRPSKTAVKKSGGKNAQSKKDQA